MSMRQLGNHHMPKGAVTSPTRRAILQHLQMHGECSDEQMHEAFKDFTTWRLSDAHKAPQNTTWLGSHLRHLRAVGHIQRRKTADGQIFWAIGTEAKSGPAEVAEPDDLEPVQVVGPRQVNVMHGPLYVPSTGAPVRPGAMDFRQFPSLMGGRRVDYRSGT